MRWPWRRRRGSAQGRVVFIGTSPFDVAAVIASVPTPSPVVSAFIPDPPALSDFADIAAMSDGGSEVPEVPEQPAPPQRIGVQLGFADGTVLEIDDDDPRAIALLAAAARLTGSG